MRKGVYYPDFRIFTWARCCVARCFYDGTIKNSIAKIGTNSELACSKQVLIAPRFEIPFKELCSIEDAAKSTVI